MIARKYGLIIMASSGIMLLQHPDVQIEDNNYIKALSASRLMHKIEKVENE